MDAQERLLWVRSSIKEKTPNQQDRNSARSSFLESNPKNPVQIPIVNTQGGISLLSLPTGSERGPLAPGLVLTRNAVSSWFLLGLGTAARGKAMHRRCDVLCSPGPAHGSRDWDEEGQGAGLVTNIKRKHKL